MPDWIEQLGRCENSNFNLGPVALREATFLDGSSYAACESYAKTLAKPLRDVPPARANGNSNADICIHADGSSWNCGNYESMLRAELRAMGKSGEQIARARERVLEILSGPSSCAAWFRLKDGDVATTFQTLNFLIDQKGESVIRATRGDWPEVTFRNPYVARVIQDGGSYQTITLNINGAFFQGTAGVLETNAQGGSPRFLTPRSISVGPYRGGSLAAQVATLLHELGHVEGLLQEDEGDVNGKSKQNTQAILEYCGDEVENSGRHITNAIVSNPIH